MRDMKSTHDVVKSVNPALRTTSVNGASADLKGYRSAMAVVHAGAVTDGTHTPSLEESDNDTDFTAVAAADLQGTFAAATANSIQRVGYIGSKRYIRTVLTTTGSPSTGAIVGASIVRGKPEFAPL